MVQTQTQAPARNLRKQETNERIHEHWIYKDRGGQKPDHFDPHLRHFQEVL